MRKLMLGICLGLAAATAGAQGVASQWRLEIGGDAESDGRIMLELSPEVGEPIRASARIADGRSENQMALNLRDALQLAVGRRYQVQVDGEDLVVASRAGERDFVIAVVENTVQGVAIEDAPE